MDLRDNQPGLTNPASGTTPYKFSFKMDSKIATTTTPSSFGNSTAIGGQPHGTTLPPNKPTRPIFAAQPAQNDPQQLSIGDKKQQPTIFTKTEGPTGRRAYISSQRSAPSTDPSSTPQQLTKDTSAKLIKLFEDVLKINNEKTTKTRNDVFLKVIDCCIQLVTDHGRPFCLIDEEAFQNLLLMIPGVENGSVTSKSIQTLIKEKANDIRKRISDEVKDKFISIKFDVLSVGFEPFLALHIQYLNDEKIRIINSQTIFLKSCGMGFKKEEIISALNNFGIDKKQIYSIAIDNGASILNKQTEMHEEGYQDIKYAVLNNFKTGTGEFLGKTPIMRSAEQAMQLAIRAALQEQDELLHTIRQSVKELGPWSKASKIQAFENSKLWESTADTLTQLFSEKKTCPTNPNVYSFPVGLTLPVETWTVIQILLDSLKPCRTLSDILQKGQLTIGDFYIHWTRCILETEKLGTKFALQITNSMKQQEKILFTDDLFVSALYLDPRINVVLTEEQQLRARDHLQRTYNHMVQLNLQIETKKDISPESGDTASNQSEVDNYFKTIFQERRQNLSKADCLYDINRDLVDFLKQPLLKADANILEYWYSKKTLYPQLYQLSNVVLSLSCTKTSAKQTYSAVNTVVITFRHEVEDAILDDILLIRNYNNKNKKDA